MLERLFLSILLFEGLLKSSANEVASPTPPSWEALWAYDDPSSGPRRRAHHAAVMMGEDDMFVFGGHDHSYDLLGDCWVWAFNESTWTRVRPEVETGMGPAPRAAAKPGAQSLEARALFFGGLVPLQGGAYFRATSNEVWVLHRGAQGSYSWSLQANAAPEAEAPLHRWGASATLWPRGESVVVFGGLSIDDEARSYQSLEDTWLYDYRAATWQRVMGREGEEGMGWPGSRFAHGAALLQGRGEEEGEGDRLVVYGGHHVSATGATGHDTTTLGDVWVLHLGSGSGSGRGQRWECVKEVGVLERGQHAMVAYGDRVLAFGGNALMPTPSPGIVPTELLAQWPAFPDDLRGFPVLRYVYDALLVGRVQEDGDDSYLEVLLPGSPRGRFALSAVVWRGALVLMGGVMGAEGVDLQALRLEGLSEEVLREWSLLSGPMDVWALLLHSCTVLVAVLSLVLATALVLFMALRGQVGGVVGAGEGGPQGRRKRSRGMSLEMIRTLPIVAFAPGEGCGGGEEEGEAGRGDSGECCAVCLMEFCANEPLPLLLCGHRYHVGCVDNWLVRNCHCPMCKRSAVPGESEGAEETQGLLQGGGRGEEAQDRPILVGDFARPSS